MTPPAAKSTPAPWILGVRVTARILLTVAALVALYFAAPLDGPVETSIPGIAILLLWTALLVGLLALQVRAIMHSPIPNVRAIEGLATWLPVLILVFAAAYYVMSSADPSTFTDPLTRTDALYFSVTIFSTVGFGDISAATESGRAVVSGNMVINMVALGLGVRIITGAAKRGEDRGSTTPSDPGSGPR